METMKSLGATRQLALSSPAGPSGWLGLKGAASEMETFARKRTEDLPSGALEKLQRSLMSIKAAPVE
jgi:hypothetical protein